MDTKVATIYMRPAMSVPLEVGPGRTINLRGGHAEVDDPSAMPTLLCDPRLTIELSERYRDHLPIWLETLEKQVRKPQARVFLPGGVELTPPDYQAYTPEVSANPPQRSEPDVVNILDEIVEAEGRKRVEAYNQALRNIVAAPEPLPSGWVPNERPHGS